VLFAVVVDRRSPPLLICMHTVEARCRTRLRMSAAFSLEQAALGCLANQVRDLAASDRATAIGRLGVERGRGRRGRGGRGRGGRGRGRRTTSFRHYRRESPARLLLPPPLLWWW
jgi:hypothetical protein